MVKMGLIGLGKMGRYHLNLHGEIAGLSLIGVCDVDADVVNEFAVKANVKGFTDYKELVKEVDAVTIAAPTKYHYEIAKYCLSQGKHVLVEKPITTNFSEAEELFSIAASKNLVLHIGHVERFNGAVQELKNIAVEPRYVETRRVGPFNPNFKFDSIVLDLMIHDIDIVINQVGCNVTSIQAMGAPVYTSIADFATVNLAFENNTIAHIYVSRINQIKERTMTVHQDNALILLDFTNQDINIYRQGQSQKIMGDKELRYKNEFIQERLFVYKDNPLKLEIKHFISSIVGGVKRVVTVEHELRSLKVALKADELISKGVYGQLEFKA